MDSKVITNAATSDYLCYNQMNKTIVFYDHSCPMCVGVTGWLHRIDHNKRFELVPYQDTEFLRNYPTLSPDRLEKQIHVVTADGDILRGADAMMEIWRKTGHPSSFLANIFRLAPFIWLARPLYNLVAKYRRNIYPNR
jgi:predicted DCC family thiol-disulfide oxidoreductase YuxK